MSPAIPVIWIAIGAVVWLLGWLGASGRLPRGHWAGFRLPSITQSDEAWFTAHRVAGPWLQGGGALTAMIGVLVLLFSPPTATADAIYLVLAVVLVATVIGAAMVGGHAAKKVAAE